MPDPATWRIDRVKIPNKPGPSAKEDLRSIKSQTLVDEIALLPEVPGDEIDELSWTLSDEPDCYGWQRPPFIVLFRVVRRHRPAARVAVIERVLRIKQVSEYFASERERTRKLDAKIARESRGRRR